MKRLHKVPADFEAVIRIYTNAEGGRTTPAFNGIRWDFAYANDSRPLELFMIHPDFYGTNGDSLATDMPLPTGTELPARMVVLFDEMLDHHRALMKVGTRFYCHEGSRRVAEGRITLISGLSTLR